VSAVLSLLVVGCPPRAQSTPRGRDQRSVSSGQNATEQPDGADKRPCHAPAERTRGGTNGRLQLIRVLGVFDSLVPMPTENKTEHIIAGLNLETDGMNDVLSILGKPAVREIAPGNPGPDDTAVSHSAWSFEAFTIHVAGWWFPRDPESEWILGVRLEGFTSPDGFQTGAGIKLGSSRNQVIQAYGEIPGQGDADLPFADGYRLSFDFDESDLVNRIQLMAPMVSDENT